MRITKMRNGALLLTVLATGLIAGCGGDSGSDATPEEVVTDFYAATSDSDPETMCALITEEVAQVAADDENADSCEEGVQASIDAGDNKAVIKLADTIEVGDATIDGDEATVAITAQGMEDEVHLVQEDGEWKLDLG
jgi:ketosteroid isomerase-like protein